MPRVRDLSASGLTSRVTSSGGLPDHRIQLAERSGPTIFLQHTVNRAPGRSERDNRPGARPLRRLCTIGSYWENGAVPELARHVPAPEGLEVVSLAHGPQAPGVGDMYLPAAELVDYRPVGY